MKEHIKDALRLNTAVLSIKYNMETCKYDQTAFAELEMAVMRAEKAMEKQAWIPVSERLPTVQDISDNMCPCFLTTEKYQSTAQRRTFNIISGEFRDGTGIKTEVLAWMPLPKLYSNEEN